MKKNFIIKNLCFYKYLFLSLTLLLFFQGNKIFGQAATATWALTANANVTTTGNITATTMTGTGVTLVAYGATNGVQTNQWATNANPVTQTTEYLEFTITPTCAALTFQSVSFTHFRNGTNGYFRLRYSVNGGAYTTISDITVNTTSTAYNSPALSVNVPVGQVLRLRLYGSTNAINTTNLYVKNFVVSGTTTTVTPTVSIAAVPAGAICSGTSVTFTATPVNGGTTPSYQWKLNGGNVGTNNPVYTNSTLINNDQVSCVMTSNLCNASPTTATSNTITMTVNGTPATPGAITGPTSAGPGSTGLTYSIAAVAGATSYNWTVPAGWTITGGAGTVAITVTSGAVGQNGNITVTASNACGTSAASSLAVSIVPPHNTCSQCHINHTAPGGQLTEINGNSNLCINCHNPSGSASSKPFTSAMKAIPGTSGTSHQWDMAAVNVPYETNMPTFNSMLLRLPGNSIICSTCHNQHTSAPASPFLREPNTSDALCKNCHTARIKTTYAMNPANKGTHPIDIAYNLADSRFQATTLPMSSGNVVCSTCHKVHASVSADGNLLRVSTSDNLCADCHTYNGYNITLNHKGMTCTTCHYAHQTGSGNIYLINDNINTPNSGLKPVVFTVNTTAANYGDASGTYNGVCEVCHTNTDHYTNTSGGTADARHVPAPQKCVNCHPHNQAFYAQTNCFDCHNAVQDKPGVGPVGGRRQIVDANGNGTGAGGDFKRTSHHVNGSIPNVSDCIKCHYMGDHKRGEVKLFDPDLGYANIITYNPADKSSVESFCLKCHDSNGANGDVTPFSDNVTVPVIDQAMWTASAHKTSASANSNTCLGCHDNGHGSNKSTLIGPYTYSGPGTGTDLMNEEEGFCFTCHGSGGAASVKVHLAFSSYTNTATNFYKHDPTATYRKHVNGETGGATFGGANRHVECVDCHNPHGAQAGTATAPTLLPTLIGETGVEPGYAGAGAPTGFTWQSSVTQEYQVCFKCHSSYTTLPTYLPGGIQNTTLVADGLKKLTTGGTNGQIADSRDMAQEFNPNNAAYHPVLAAGKNLNINANTFQTGWTYQSRMYCTDCHNNPLATTAGHGNGPHGSSNLHMLDKGAAGTADYPTYHSASNTNAVCTKCHKPGSYISGDVNSRFQYHNYHYGKTSTCYDCHDSHGSEREHNMNFSRNVPSCITAFGASPYNTSQSAFNHVAGTATNACVLTCHGVSHSTGSKTYNPAY